MIFAILFEDNDEFAGIRPQLMPDHLKFLQSNSDAIRYAGPLCDGSSNEPAGGLWIVEADGRDAAQSLVEEDPFWPTGLRKSVRILAWTQVFANGARQVSG